MDKLKALFVKHNIKFQEIDDKRVVLLHSIPYFDEVGKQVVSFNSSATYNIKFYCPYVIHRSNFPKVAEAMNLMNLNLAIGSWELDWSDGVAAFKASFRTTADYPSPAKFEQLLLTTYHTNTVTFVRGCNAMRGFVVEHPEASSIHRVSCDECAQTPIIGKRYKCKTCSNFDLCEMCMKDHKKKAVHPHNEFAVLPEKDESSDRLLDLLKLLMERKPGEDKKPPEDSSAEKNVPEAQDSTTVVDWDKDNGGMRVVLSSKEEVFCFWPHYFSQAFTVAAGDRFFDSGSGEYGTFIGCYVKPKSAILFAQISEPLVLLDSMKYPTVLSTPVQNLKLLRKNTSSSYKCKVETKWGGNGEEVDIGCSTYSTLGFIPQDRVLLDEDEKKTGTIVGIHENGSELHVKWDLEDVVSSVANVDKLFLLCRYGIPQGKVNTIGALYNLQINVHSITLQQACGFVPGDYVDYNGTKMWIVGKEANTSAVVMVDKEGKIEQVAIDSFVSVAKLLHRWGSTTIEQVTAMDQSTNTESNINITRNAFTSFVTSFIPGYEISSISNPDQVGTVIGTTVDASKIVVKWNNNNTYSLVNIPCSDYKHTAVPMYSYISSDIPTPVIDSNKVEKHWQLLVESFGIQHSSLKNLEKIGQGGFGTVYKCFKDRVPVAYKEITISGIPDMKEVMQELKHEVVMLFHLNHPNIIQFYHIVTDKLGFVTEYMDMNYKDAIQKKKLSWPQKHNLLLQIAKGVLCLHNKNIVHRDLKGLNILVSQDAKVAKVTDFGLAKMKLATVSSSKCEPKGTVPYMSPERLDSQISGSKADDVYAYSMMMYETMIENFPWSLEKLNMAQMLTKVIQQQRPRIPDTIVFPTKEYKDKYIELMKKCWSHDPKHRCTMGVIIDSLESMESLLK